VILSAVQVNQQMDLLLVGKQAISSLRIAEKTLNYGQCTYFGSMWMIRQALQFVAHLFKTKTPAQMHSPFLYALLTKIHQDEPANQQFTPIEQIRKALVQNKAAVSDIDFGAGNRSGGRQKGRTVRDIARTSLSSPSKCRLISRLIADQKPQTILELGTSLGIMSAYLASADEQANLYTVEANPDIISIARQTIRKLDIQNVRFYQGSFNDVLPVLIREINPIGFTLIDGDHRGSALLRYYHQIKPVLAEDAIVMIDDIRWSSDMYDAWREILLNDDITCSLDYFSFGLLLFRKEFKENLRLRIRGRLMY
jgi:predicted O-methyltransferase YrrM